MAGSFGELGSTSDPDAWFARRFGARTSAGPVVSEQSALQLSVAYACISILAQDVAKLPLHMFEETKAGGSQRVKDHPAAYALHSEANPTTSAFVFRECMQGHLGSWGNAYSNILRDRADRVIGFEIFTPERVRPLKANNGRTYYDVKDDNSNYEAFSAEEILHIPGFGYDGLVGYSPIAMARQAIGLGLAVEEFGARWFGQGQKSGVYLSHPASLSDKAAKRLESYMNDHGGLEHSHLVRVLEEGMELKHIHIPPDDAQFLQTRKFQIAELARFYRMPLHKLQEIDKAIKANIEQQSIEYVVDTLNSWLVRWEQELNRKLFRGRERGRFFVKFNTTALLRGDNEARAKFYQSAVGGPFMKPNEARALEEMNPVPGGDELLKPMNMSGNSDNEE